MNKNRHAQERKYSFLISLQNKTVDGTVLVK